MDGPPKVKSADPKKWSDTAIMTGFWWVGKSADISICNMQWSKSTTPSGVAVPIMINLSAVKDGETLCIYEAPTGKSQKRKAA